MSNKGIIITIIIIIMILIIVVMIIVHLAGDDGGERDLTRYYLQGMFCVSYSRARYLLCILLQGIFRTEYYYRTERYFTAVFLQN